MVLASTYGLKTLVLSELHQHKLQVCENNWIIGIAGVKIVERRIMKYLKEEVGTKACIVGKIVKSRMKWADTRSERRKINYQKDQRQRSKKVSENNEEDHR